MADEFPEDSFFRNSNVAVLEAAIQEKNDVIIHQSRISNVAVLEAAILEKKDANIHQSSGNTSSGVSSSELNSSCNTSSFMTVKRSLVSKRSYKSSTSKSNANRHDILDTSEEAAPSKSTKSKPKKRGLRSRSHKDVGKFEKPTHCCDKESNESKTNNSEKSDVKDKSKNCYRPLNITKNSALSCKQSASSSNDVHDSASLFSVNCTHEETGGSNSSLLTTQQKLKLDAWGLPQSILTQYAKRGITEMFPWQVECLCCPRVLNGGNLIYSAPTSAGKTLVSEIVCIKTILERRQKVLFVLPFVSVVREKMFYFQEIFRGSKVRVDGYMGGHSAPGGFRSLDLAVCTIEKANSLMNRLMEENELDKLGAVVVDELHLIGDSHRGYLLELLLTKLKYMLARKNELSIQLIGMSATLPNLSLLSTWLDADLYKTSFRPVPLVEYIKIGNTLLDSTLKPVRTISPELKIKNDTEDIVYLCLETIANGHSVLIFCPTKAWCESLAQTVACEFRSIGLGRDVNAPESLAFKLREQLNADRISECLEQLRSCPVGLDKVLAKMVSFGVAYHHAGLSMDERDILEGCFKNGTLRVLIATTTLSSGVNLPARRVIIRSPVFQGRSIDILSYRQMVGRAGRMGVDSAGESIMICQKTEQRIVANLVSSTLKPIESCLGLGDLSASLKRAILEVIASKVASTPEDLEMYTNCTLLSASHDGKESHSNPVSACIKFLQENELIRLQTGEDKILRYTPTPLGLACLSASIHPDEGLRLFQELQRARQCFVLENDLHLVYQVTPFNVADQWGNLDWLHVLTLWEQLTPDLRRVGELVGVEDRFIVRAMRGTVNIKLEKQREKLSIHKRFYTALALYDLVNEIPLNVVASKFNCSRGLLQSLQQSASTYAGMVTSFCRRLGWASVELLVDQFQDRLHFGTHRELLDLLRVPSLNGPRARALYSAGITCISELTTADILVVENALHSAIPFLSEKERDGETAFDSERRRKLKGIWITGRQGLSEQEAAELLIKEARAIVQAELGLTEVNWGQRKQEHIVSPSSNDSALLDRSHDVCSSPSIHVNSSLKIEVKENISRENSTSIALAESKFSLPLQNSTKMEISTGKKEDVKETLGCGKPSEVNEFPNAETTHTPKVAVNLNVIIQNKKVLENKLKPGEIFSSPSSSLKDVSTDLLDNNISDDALNISETEEINISPLSTRPVAQKTPVVSSGVRLNDFQSSIEDLFESSISNSALAKLDGNSDRSMMSRSRISDDGGQDIPQTLDPVNHGDTVTALESWGITNSILDKLCIEEEKCVRVASTKEGLNSSEKMSSSRRLSADLFAASPSESSPAIIINQKCDVKESEDLFGSFSTPSFGRKPGLREMRESDQSNSQQSSLISPAQDKSLKSPNLFGDSFEINTGLMQALDGDKNHKIDGLEPLKTSVPPEGELKAKPESNPVENSVGDSINTSSCGATNKREQNKTKRRILGSTKSSRHLMQLSEKSKSPDDVEGSIQSSKRSTPVKRSCTLHLGLTRRKALKKCAVKNDVAGNVIAPKEANKSDVLTDSFLEAAFETAFHNVTSLEKNIPQPSTENLHSATTVLSENNNYQSDGTKNLKVNDSSDERIIHHPHKNVIVKELSYSSDEEVITPAQENINLKTSRNLAKIRTCLIKSPEKEDKLSRKRKHSPTDTENVIGPPLTRKMLAKRQKSSCEGGRQLNECNGNSSYPTCNNHESLKNPFDSTLVEDWSSFTIIDVCRNETLFKTFAKEILNTTLWSISFACECNEATVLPGAIGSKITKSQKPKQNSKLQTDSQFSFGDHVLVGVSFSFGATDAYFLSLESKSHQCVVDLKDRLQLLEKILCHALSRTVPTVCCFDFKEHYKMLFRCTGLQIRRFSVLDPKIGDWLLEPEGKEKTFPAMVLKYLPQAIQLAEYAGNARIGLGSLALDIHQTLPARQRSSVESILCYQIMNIQYGKLQDTGLLSCFMNVEMPVTFCVAGMELVGIGFCAETIQSLQEKVREEMCALERKAYQLAGRSFSLTSPTDTARVLYQELKLGQGQSLKGRQRNTSKDTLTKLCNEHPLPNVILLWRKMNAIHSKTVCPLLPTGPCTRLYGLYIMHTATGRISMHEPNIQCIPRDFEMSEESKQSLCMRAAFVASEGCTLVAADYSQLELRLLAHFSGEPKLRDILNSGQDVFSNLAAVWNNIPFEQVTDDLRQKSKQLCYGIIYGMGTRALADQLEVEESKAAELMEAFYHSFPGLNRFIEETMSLCHEQGYVKTLLGRRRYLPGITSSNLHVKAHSKRQAVNTTVQGSAADLTKTAMISIENSIHNAFPLPVYCSEKTMSLKVPQLVLHLHDELMYEVPLELLDQFCGILKQEMECAISLSVKLPVKVKVGTTWGTMTVRDSGC